MKDLEWVIQLVVGDLMYLFDQKDYTAFKELRKQYADLVNTYYAQKRLVEKGDGTCQ